MVRVVDVRKHTLGTNEVLIRVDRSSPVGNPFYMHNESERDSVCDKYEQYFAEHIIKGADKAFRDYIVSIYRTAQKQDVALGCFCFPRRCHADTIARFINSKL